MKLEDLIHTVQSKLDFNESYQLVEALKNDPNQVIDLLIASQKNSPDAFINKLTVFLEKEQQHSSVEQSFETTASNRPNEFDGLVEELSKFNLTDIIQILVKIDTTNPSPYGDLIAKRLVYGLIDYLSVEDYEDLISYEEVAHLY